MQRVWLITGTSRGFGRAFAQEALRRGDIVVAGARHIEQEDTFWQQGHLMPVTLDVTDPDEVADAVQAAIRAFGRIDVLVNNAGYGMSGAFEEVSEEQLRDLVETDYFGTAAMIRAVLPYMRARRSGMILNVSSQGGLMGFGGSTAYCSAKFAVVGLSIALRMELEPLGIQVSAVCPGSFRTDFRVSGAAHQPEATIADYEGTPAHGSAAFYHANLHTQKGDPEKAASFLCDMVASGTLPERLLIGEACCTQVLDDLKGQAREIEGYRKASSKTDFAE